MTVHGMVELLELVAGQRMRFLHGAEMSLLILAPVMLKSKMKWNLPSKNGPAAELRINQNGAEVKMMMRMVKKAEMVKVEEAKRTRMERTIQKSLQAMKKMEREKEAKKVKKVKVPSETSLTKTGLNNTRELTPTGGSTAIADQLVMAKSQLGGHVKVARLSQSNVNLASKRKENGSSATEKMMKLQSQQLSHAKPNGTTLDADPDAQQKHQNANVSMMLSQSLKLQKKLLQDTQTGKINAKLSEVHCYYAND